MSQLISTARIQEKLKTLLFPFKNTHTFPPFWICSRKGNVSFRPSSIEMVKTNLELAVRLTKVNHVVAIPLVFYQCDQKGEYQENQKESHYTKLHYNLLLIYRSHNKLFLERYEPNSTEKQEDLHLQLEKKFQEVLPYPFTFVLFARHGLQTTDDLCGYHILFWAQQRLLFGKEKTRLDFSLPEMKKKFELFLIEQQKTSL